MIILSEPKFKTQTTAWNDRESIPNQEGFKLVVLVKIQGNTFPVLETVVKDATGCHMLKDTRIIDVLGWRKATAEELTLKPE